MTFKAAEQKLNNSEQNGLSTLSTRNTHCHRYQFFNPIWADPSSEIHLMQKILTTKRHAKLRVANK
jgi:hypothetical protein